MYIIIFFGSYLNLKRAIFIGNNLNVLAGIPIVNIREFLFDFIFTKP